MPNGDGADGAGPGPGEERAGSAAAKQRDGGGAGDGAVRRSQRPLGSPPGPSPRIRLALSRGQAITIPASWRGKGALRGSAVFTELVVRRDSNPREELCSGPLRPAEG